MTHLAMAFCIIAALTVFLRAEMLRQRLDPKRKLLAEAELLDDDAEARPTYAGNYPMIVCLDLAGIGFVGMFLSFVVRGSQASPELTFLLGTCSLSATVTLGSMIAHNWRELVRGVPENLADEIEKRLPSALEKGVHAFMAHEPPYTPEPPQAPPTRRRRAHSNREARL